MSVSLSPVGGAGAQFFDSNGDPLSGGKLYTYEAGTSTPATTYTTSAGNVASANPIVLDAAGRVSGSSEIWLTNGSAYKFVLKDSNDVLIATWDNVPGMNDAAFAYYTPAATSLLPATPITVKSALDQITNEDDGASLIGYLPDYTGAAAQTVKAKLKQYISVKDFGATGDGTTDDSAAIIAANAAAATAGKSVFFPAGTYRGTNLQATTSWFGEQGSVVKCSTSPNSADATKYTFAYVNGTSDLIFQDLTFDGNVSADPVSWNSSNYDSFTGALAFVASNCDNLRFLNCTFQNSQMSPLRFDTCTNIVVEGCLINRGRGNFGDGVYIRASSGILFSNCTANDVTRIGFVTEAMSYNCSFVNCKATYAHDASTNYGGGEFNGGFWYENSANNITIGCRAQDVGNRGFTATTGTVTGLPTQYAFYEFTNCVAVECDTGFVTAPKSGTSAQYKFVGCMAWNTIIGFQGIANNATDSFTYVGCHAETNFGSGANSICYSYGGSTTAGDFRYTNCTTSYLNYDAAELNDTTTNTADFSTSSVGTCNVVIDNARNINSTYPIAFKGRSGDLGVSFSNCSLKLIIVDEADVALSINDSTISYADISGNGKVSIDGCTITGFCSVAVENNVSVTNCKVIPVGTDPYLRVVSNINSKRPAVEIRNCYFEKDIATNDYVLRIQEEGTNKPNVIINDCVFYNSGAATALKAFIWVVRTGTPMNFFDCASDANVTYLTLTNATLGNPGSGDTKLTFH